VLERVTLLRSSLLVRFLFDEATADEIVDECAPYPLDFFLGSAQDRDSAG
jgi:hypothetical protein